MIQEKLINPKSIVIVGASNNLKSPGGSVLLNLISHKFKGKLYAVNPKETIIQGVKCYQNILDIPTVDLAILAIPAKLTLETVKILAHQKKTKGFIVFSAGFSEKDVEGKILEQQLVKVIDAVGGSLLGPNNIGLINQNYVGVFTKPIPKLNSKGVDFISSSGATAVFILEAAISVGLNFSSIYSVGNSAQIGVEEMLAYLDTSFDIETSSTVKLLYLESIKNPEKFLKHAISLAKKGCKIAAIKAGSSKAGSRAASSHTGALANSDVAIDALFQKAGIIRCYGRNELITIASIFMYPELKGKNIAIITHAGGPAVLLTDVLSKNGFNVPQIKGKESLALLKKLYPGASVSNPIDFLATGNAEQLETIINYCETKFDSIDAMVVIFGSPGLFEVYDVYDVLHKKIHQCKKPIFAVLPSIENAKNELDYFISKNNVIFPEEVIFGKALTRVYNTIQPDFIEDKKIDLDKITIRKIIDCSKNGYLHPIKARKLLIAAQIPMVKEFICNSKNECLIVAQKIGFPLVMKIIGPIHKTDANGIILNITSEDKLIVSFDTIMKIKSATAVLIQAMKTGMELFIGAKKESDFGHLILCGLGGIYVEVFNDIQTCLAPVSKKEAIEMVKNLKSYKIIKGIRNQEGINEQLFIEIILKISNLMSIAPEIIELDLNPLMGNSKEIITVDARIRIEKTT